MDTFGTIKTIVDVIYNFVNVKRLKSVALNLNQIMIDYISN